MELEAEGVILCQKLTLGPNGVGAGSLVGLFNTLQVKRVPTPLPDCWFYATIVGIRQPTKLTMRFVFLDPDESEPALIWEEDQTLPPPQDVRTSIPILCRMGGSSLPKVGEYRLELRSGSRLVGSKRLFVEVFK